MVVVGNKPLSLITVDVLPIPVVGHLSIPPARVTWYSSATGRVCIYGNPVNQYRPDPTQQYRSSN